MNKQLLICMLNKAIQDIKKCKETFIAILIIFLGLGTIIGWVNLWFYLGLKFFGNTEVGQWITVLGSFSIIPIFLLGLYAYNLYERCKDKTNG